MRLFSSLPIFFFVFFDENEKKATKFNEDYKVREGVGD